MPRRSLGLVLPCFARLVTCAVHTGCVRSLYHVQRKESRYVLCCQLVASKLVLCSTPFIRCPCTATEMTDTRLRTALDSEASISQAAPGLRSTRYPRSQISYVTIRCASHENVV